MRCFQSSPSLVFRVFQLASLRVSFPFFIFTVCFARPDKWINGIRVDWLDPIDINVGCIEKLTRRVHFVRYFCCCCCLCVCVCVCDRESGREIRIGAGQPAGLHVGVGVGHGRGVAVQRRRAPRGQIPLHRRRFRDGPQHRRPRLAQQPIQR